MAKGLWIFAVVLLAEHHVFVDRLVQDKAIDLARARGLRADLENRPLIVQMTDATIVGQRRNPFPRPVLAKVIEKLETAHPKAIVVDFFLDEESADDAALARVLKKNKNIILTQALYGQPDDYLVRPVLPAFLTPETVTGVAAFPIEPDGTVREFEAEVKLGKHEYPHVLTQTLKMIGRPDLMRHSTWIDYGAPLSKVAQTVDGVALLYDQSIVDWKKLIAKDKTVVFIGAYDSYSADRLKAPIRSAEGTGEIAGTEVQAYALGTLLRNQTSYEISHLYGYLLSLLFYVFAWFGTAMGHSDPRWTKAWIGTLLVYFSLSVVLAVFGGFWPISLPFAGTVIGWHMAEAFIAKPPVQETAPKELPAPLPTQSGE